MPRVRIGKRGTIVIPKEIREKMGLKEGTTVLLTVRNGEIVSRKNDLWQELRMREKA